MVKGPVYVTFPAEYVRYPEKVVVDTHAGMPPEAARTWPPVPMANFASELVLSE